MRWLSSRYSLAHEWICKCMDQLTDYRGPLFVFLCAYCFCLLCTRAPCGLFRMIDWLIDWVPKRINQFRDCASVLRSLKIGCAISRLARNFGILRMRKFEIAKLPRLRGTYIRANKTQYLHVLSCCLHCSYQPQVNILFVNADNGIHCSLHSSILWRLSARSLCCSSSQVPGAGLQWLRT